MEKKRKDYEKTRMSKKNCIVCSSEFFGTIRALYCKPSCRSYNFYSKKRKIEDKQKTTTLKIDDTISVINKKTEYNPYNNPRFVKKL